MPKKRHKPFTEDPFFGRTLNPVSQARTCGSSSGGTAVAAGMGQFAFGTDGGSIRIPVACCSVVDLPLVAGWHADRYLLEVAARLQSALVAPHIRETGSSLA